jgi:hypothetical protein
LKLVAAVLVVGAAGCASAAPDPRGPWTPEPVADLAAAEPVAAPASAQAPSATLAAIASIPTGTTAIPRQDDTGKGAETGEVRVTAPRTEGSPLREERRIGSNEQPEWTTERTFTTVRAYVIAPGQIEVEQWYKLQNPQDSAPNHFWQSEVSMGFEGGWQADFYVNYGKEPNGPTKYDGVQYEVRKALAKWGEIPANPTLYAEYVENFRAADKVELKLLLADEICTGWHWASNLFWEQLAGEDRETELGMSAGIMHTLIDSKFSAGAEAKYERLTGNGFRSEHDAQHELLVGPSFQWRPTENMHVDVAPLFGLTKSDRRDPRTEIYIVIGYDFGPEREGRREAPTSTRAK